MHTLDIFIKGEASEHMETFDQLHSYKPIMRCFKISNVINVIVGVLGILSAVLSPVMFEYVDTKTGLITLLCGAGATIASVLNYFFIKLVFSVFHNLFWTRENLDYLVRRLNARNDLKQDNPIKPCAENLEKKENSEKIENSDAV